MRLFDLDETYKVIFNPELFLLKDFKDLRDDRNDVDILYKELGYIYYFCDLRSDFQFEINPKKRSEDVKRFVGLDEDWEPDELVETCMKAYKYLSQTVSSQLLQTAYLGVDKFTEQIKSIDLNERDKNLRPIWNQKQIMDIINNVPELLETIRKAENEYLKNHEAETKLRGDKLATLYEKGFKGIMLDNG